MRSIVVALALLLAGAADADAEPPPLPKTGQSPAGYAQSGGFCAPTSERSPVAVPKGRGQCPSNSVQSGDYCVKARRR
jgi:hypothetical protein